MEIVIDYKPTVKQGMFHASCADEVLYGGAAGGGKSVAIVMDALLRCLTYPGTTAYIFRRTYAELDDTVIKEAKARYPRRVGRYNAGRHEYYMVNGSVIRFRHCAAIADMYNYSGAEIHWLYFDELTSFEFDIYTFLKTRLRAKKSLGIVPLVRCSSNPGNIGHGWVKKYFVDAGPFMEVVERTVHSKQLAREIVVRTQYIPSLATENPHITDDYIFQLEQKPEALKRALLFGEWDAFEGQVFPEFTDNPAGYKTRIGTHVIEPFDLPVNWPRYMSFDHGYSRPFSVGWWAVGPRGEMYRYREWYGCETNHPNTGIKLSPPEIARGIVEREACEAAENITIDRIADPAIFEHSRGPSVAEQMQPVVSRSKLEIFANIGRPGVYFRKGDNARLAGKMQLHERLRFNEAGQPMLYVFSACQAFIRTIPTLPYDPTHPEDVDTDAEDHVYDEVRYALMARPMPVIVTPALSVRGYDPYSED